MALLYLATAVSTVPIFLVTWRIARRFGWRGLAVTFAVAAVGGPPREFAVEAKFPEWITYASGVATVMVRQPFLLATPPTTLHHHRGGVHSNH